MTLRGFALIGFLAFLNCGSTQQSANSVASPALQLWERILAKKGGRERLTRIENFLIVTKQAQTRRLLDVDLYMFPNRFWTWNDGRPSPIGVRMDISDGTGTWSAIAEWGRRRNNRDVKWFPFSREQTFALIRDEARFLLETRWLQPGSLQLGTGQIGKRRFDTIVADYGIDDQFKFKYYIDSETLLVSRVAQLPEKNTPSTLTEWDFDEYKLIDGVMMPSRKRQRSFGTFLLDFEFNVEYDPAIFTRRPAIEDGPDGWKPNK